MENEQEDYAELPLGTSALSKYFETIFELQKQMLDLQPSAKIDQEKNVFSQESLIANISRSQETQLNYIYDYIGELQFYGLFEAVPTFNIKAFGILNLSRSRSGFQQNMFTTQTIQQNITQDQKRKQRRWFKNE